MFVKSGRQVFGCASSGDVLVFDNNGRIASVAPGRPREGDTLGILCTLLSTPTDALADLIALDADAVDLFEKCGGTVWDSYFFADNHRLITDVWSAGRHQVRDGRHIAHGCDH